MDDRTYRDDVHEALDRFADTVPGFEERIADGRPLRFAVEKMLSAAFDLTAEETERLIAEWLKLDPAEAQPAPTPPPPSVTVERLDRLNDKLSMHAGDGTSEEASVRMEIATILFDYGHLDEALAYAMHGREILEAVGDRAGAATATMEIGLIQQGFGWTDDAIQSYLAAKTVLEVDDPARDLAAVCSNLGNSLKRKGEPRHALFQYEVAARLYERYGDERGTAIATFNIASTHFNLGRWGEALEGFSRARQTYESLDMPAQVADCDLAIADTWFHSGNGSAITLAANALRRYEELELPVEVAHAQLVVAHMADHAGNHDLARDLCQQATSYYLDSNMWAEAVHAATVLAHAESYAGDREASLQALGLARRISKDQGLPWDAKFDARLIRQIENSTLPKHSHPEQDLERTGDSIVDEGFLDALRLAVELHGNQRRKSADGDPPGPSYTGHILAVAGYIIDAGGTREQAIAGLLHDSVEDSAATINDIAVLFGDTVARYVDACTDAHIAPKPPWRDRKEKYIDHLSTTKEDALLVSAADKLQNARAMIRDHRVHGDALWDRFNTDADHKWYYQKIAQVMQERLDNPIAGDLSEAVEHLTRLMGD